jgi:hypothetical protein
MIPKDDVSAHGGRLESRKVLDSIARRGRAGPIFLIDKGVTF